MTSLADKAAFDSYAQRISATYPSFLRRLGLDRMAVKAEGAVIIDSAGTEYVDCVAGYGVCNLGHNPPEIVGPLMDLLRGSPQATRPFIVEPQVRFAEMLEDVAPGRLSCSAALNSGSEAIEFALKLARLATRRREIICTRGSFFGHTYGALSASGIPSFARPFEPLVPGFVHVDFGDMTGMEAAVTDDTAAVLLEVVQHETGVHLPPSEYLSQVRRLCDERRILLMVDEVKTGLGKTGRMFACEHYGIEPDVLILGKSLGAGLIPVGAVLAEPRLWRVVGLSFPMSASSYAGNALAACVGCASLAALSEELLADCRRKGAYLLEATRRCARRHPDVVVGSEGLGLLIGMECSSARTATALVKALIAEGILVLPAFGNGAVVMIEPSLVISDAQVEQVALAMNRACADLDAKRGVGATS